MNMRRATRTALLGPLVVAGGVFALTVGSTNAFAASSTSVSASTHASTTATLPQNDGHNCDPGHIATADEHCCDPGHIATADEHCPGSSSRPHKHEHVDCDPGHVTKNGDCQVVFSDPKTKGEPSPVGQQVCFTVTPVGAGSVETGHNHCATVGVNHKAVGTFNAGHNFCGEAVITATEGKEKQSHHTTVIVCKNHEHDATTTAAIIPAGSPLPPAGGWLLGALGVGVALVTGYALRTRRWFVPGRLTAGQSA